MYSEEHDPRELAKYVDLPPPPLPCGTPVYTRVAELGVSTSELVYGRHHESYLRSAYYNEYQAPNRAFDALIAALGPGGPCVGATAALQFWHDRPVGRTFGERELALLRLLLPAFESGIATLLRWGGAGRDLLGVLDQLGQAVILCDAGGRIAQSTPAMEAALAADPEAERLRGELLAEAERLRHTSRPGSAPDPARCCPGGRQVRTAYARYHIGGCLYGGPPAGASPLVLVRLERVGPVQRSEEEIRAAFGLTRAETLVAMLLAQGKSNAQIAQELFLSPHTIRRHTEKILRKMGISSRSEVAGRLHG